MDLTFSFKPLFEREHGVFKEFLLVLVLVLNVLIDFTVFFLLILDEFVQTLIYSHFQLLVIVSILDNLVDCVFEVVDYRVVVS